MSLFVALLAGCVVVNTISILACFPTRGRRLVLFFIGTVAVSIATFGLNSVIDDPHGLYRFIPRGAQYLPVLFLLKHDKKSQMFFFIVSVLTISCLMCVYGGFIGSLFFEQSTAASQWAAFWSGLALLLVFLFSMLKWGRTLYRRIFLDVKLKLWPVYCLYPIFALYVLNFFYLSELGRFPSLRSAGAEGVLLSIFILIGFILLYSAIISTYQRAKLGFALELSQSIINGGREYYEQLAQRIDELSILRHDYKHHLNVMNGLIQAQRFDEADAYLRRAEEALEETAIPHYCANRVVDALLGQMARHCREDGISFEAQVDLGMFKERKNYELCTFLGNLLENAREGCLNVQGGRGRFVQLTIKPKGNQLALQLENSYDGIIRMEDGALMSRKKNGGRGLRSARIIVDRLGGDLQLHWTDEVFTAHALLSL